MALLSAELELLKMNKSTLLKSSPFESGGRQETGREGSRGEGGRGEGGRVENVLTSSAGLSMHTQMMPQVTWSPPFTVRLIRSPTVSTSPTAQCGSYGIGVHFVVTAAYMTAITGFLPGGSADLDGRLRQGDVIMAIDDTTLRPEIKPTSEFVANLILGPEASPVTLTVSRATVTVAEKDHPPSPSSPPSMMTPPTRSLPQTPSLKRDSSYPRTSVGTEEGEDRDKGGRGGKNGPGAQKETSQIQRRSPPQHTQHLLPQALNVLQPPQVTAYSPFTAQVTVSSPEPWQTLHHPGPLSPTVRERFSRIADPFGACTPVGGGAADGGQQLRAGLAVEKAGLAVETDSFVPRPRDVAEWEGMHGRREERGGGGRGDASRGEEDAAMHPPPHETHTPLPPHGTSDFVWPTRKSNGYDAPRPGKPVHGGLEEEKRGGGGGEGRGGAGDVFTASPLAGNISTFFQSVLPPREREHTLSLPENGRDTLYA